ncbi:MAG: carbamate kinase [Gemmatimonadota bacterium]|nr:MAG: carbamate kinase [Gemmatimonadota bacterium]
MRIVMALGGNALLRRGEEPTAAVQREHIQRAARAVAEVARQHTVVVTHGNGPQVGLLAAREIERRKAYTYPLDVLGAESMGMIGYLIEQALTNELPGQPIATLLTQVEVHSDDPAFDNPTKPIGPVLTKGEAEQLSNRHGWSVAPEGKHYRRVVASPHPLRVLQSATIKSLVDDGVLVICGGGGGIPVVSDKHGTISGVEAVIDKDRTAELLARSLGADALLLLTDVAAVQARWGSPDAESIRMASPSRLRGMDFAAGSMGPKVDAACRFVESGLGFAGIGAIEDAAAILLGDSGTIVRSGEA